MTAVEVADELLTIHVQGIDRFWALRRRIIVPLSHVRSIERTAHRTWRPAGFRLLGAEVPGLLRIGRFSRHGERVFWDVHHPERTIEIELANEPFDRLIVEVKNPEETTREVQRAIARRSAARSDRSPRCRPNSNVNNPPQPRERLDHVAQQGPVHRRKRGGDPGPHLEVGGDRPLGDRRDQWDGAPSERTRRRRKQ